MRAGSAIRALAMLLHPAPLIVIVVMSLAMTVSFKTAPFGLPLALILLSWFFKYSYASLDELISGAKEMPVLSVEMITQSVGEWRSLMPLILSMAAFFLSGAASFWVGIALTIALAVPLLVALPAVIAVQGWTGSASQALNPKRCLRMAALLGADYPLMVSTVLAMTVVAAGSQVLSARVPMAIRLGLFVYTWLALFVLTGTSIRNHRASIEADTLFVKPEKIDDAERLLEQERHSWLDAIYAEARGGAFQSAWQTVLRHLDRVADPLRELRWVYGRVSHWKLHELSNRIAAELIGRLLDINAQAEAVRVARDRLAVDSRFRPRRATDTLRLAMFAGTGADRATAIQLLDRFDDYYPNDSLREKASRLKHNLQSGARATR